MRARVCFRAALALAVLVIDQPGAFAQDAAAGEKVFAKCRTCHMVGPGAQNAVGPNLSGLEGRKTGTEPGYSYSDSNRGSGLTWDEATFKDYIRDPKAKIPGTKMTFAGLAKQSEIDNVWAYLKTFNPDGTRKP